MRKLAFVCATLLSITPLRAASRRHIVGRAGADPVFGVSVNVAGRSDTTEISRALDFAQQDGIGWIRIPFTWSAIQPSAGIANFVPLTTIVAHAVQDNLHIVGILGYSTPWNTTAPSTETRAAQRERYPPADYDAWSRYIVTTVSVFKSSVHHWEIWNSPDVGLPADPNAPCNGSWCGTAAQYAQLLSVAYKAVKSADPTANVLFGGLSLSPDADPNFLYNVLTDSTHPGVDSFEILAFHVYGSKTEALRRMNLLKSQMAYGGSGTRPFWVTEFGYPSDPALQNVPPYFNGESGQAAYLRDLAGYLLVLGVRKLFWYQLFDSPGDVLPTYGLLTPSFVQKQSYTAYGEFINSYHP